MRIEKFQIANQSRSIGDLSAKNVNVKTQEPPSFQGNLPRLLKRAGIASFTAIGMFWLVNEGFLGANEHKIAKTSGWGENVRVLASNGQNLTAFSYPKGLGSYSTKLTDRLYSSGVNTIEAANDSLAKNGYRVMCQKFHALETPGKKLNIFNKQEKNKSRFVLVVSENDPNNPKYLDYANDFAAQMQRIYKIPQKNIVKISANFADDFAHGIDSVMKKIKTTEHPELVIMYSGSGEAISLKKGAKKVEGEKEGILLDGVRETELKRIFKEKLGKIKTIFIDSSSHSGAFIAMTKEAGQNLSRLA